MQQGMGFSYMGLENAVSKVSQTQTRCSAHFCGYLEWPQYRTESRPEAPGPARQGEG